MGIFDFLKKEELNEINSLKQQLQKYKPIMNIENEVEKINTEIQSKSLELNAIETKVNGLLTLQGELESHIELYTQDLENIECGLYEPMFDFDTAESYKAKKINIIQQQKLMLKNNQATTCDTNWTVSGSVAKGKAFIKKNTTLVLKAFNGDCDALISKVRWNNVDKIRDRMVKSFDTINKLGKDSTISITQQYLDLKIQEMAITYEYEQKKQEEKEVEREIRAQMREEEKARREYEKAQRDAEKMELQYLEELERAKRESSLVTGEEHEKLKLIIEQLELQLKEAQENKERAMSMAQQTRRGHVYVISNIGSFGKDVYKIGMTRRLEPLDRVKELGDASVPFTFDVHAMIFSEDAPALENQLHKEFDNMKVNMFNNKKEFFRVSLDEVERVVNSFGVKSKFIKIAEAEEYRETITLISKLNKN